MSDKRYIIEVKAPSPENGEIKFYSSFEGFYSTICNLDKSYFHLLKKVKPTELKKNPSEIFGALILTPTIDCERSVKVNVRTPTKGNLQGILSKKGVISPRYQLVFDSLSAV